MTATIPVDAGVSSNLSARLSARWTSTTSRNLSPEMCTTLLTGVKPSSNASISFCSASLWIDPPRNYAVVVSNIRTNPGLSPTIIHTQRSDLGRPSTELSTGSFAETLSERAR